MLIRVADRQLVSTNRQDETQDLQALVGSYIEAMKPTAQSVITMIVNEERLVGDLPDNLHCPGLCGNVVVGKAEDGEFLGLSASELAVLLRDGWRHR